MGITKWFCVDFSTIDYHKAWELQKKTVNLLIKNKLDTNLIFMLEHFPVFTLGRRGGINNLLVSEKHLKKNKISVVKIERGGDITYHGPGQLVVYPIVNLERIKMGVASFVEALEEIMIRVLAKYDVNAKRNSLNPGVWVDSKKIGSIGLAVRHKISFHGFSLNINVDLKPFSWINPCGLKEIDITSLEKETSENLSKNISMDKIRQNVKNNVESLFGIKLINLELQTFLENINNYELSKY